MSNVKEELKNYPDISFIENLTLDDLQGQMIADFEEKYKEITGKEFAMGQADPYRLILYASSLQIYQAYQYLDNAGKQSFLKYSHGEYLENLGALKGIYRSNGKAAVTTIRFTVSEPQKDAITIPLGTRCTAGDNVFFYTTEATEIPALNTHVDIPAECAGKGVFANGYGIGKINILVDMIPYIASVENIAESAGGTESETDESLAERIYMAQSSYSVAGPEDAYVYWVKTFNPSVEDVKVTSPAGGVVDIRFIVQNGEIPEQETVNDLQQKIEQSEIRPLTDKVAVSAPNIVNYNIAFKYWVNESDKSKAKTIQENIKSAVEAYKKWQSEKIGRDINPSKLLAFIINAGAKRAEIMEPVFTGITDISIPQITKEPQIIFGGIEDD